MGTSGNPAKKAAAAKAEPVEYDPTPVDADGAEDFDAFWEQHDEKRVRPTARIMGELIELPPALPLQTEMLMQRLQRRNDNASVRQLLASLYREDRLDQWAEAGMDGDKLQVLLAWTIQRINGGTLSMAEVAAKIAEAEASGEA